MLFRTAGTYLKTPLLYLSYWFDIVFVFPLKNGFGIGGSTIPLIILSARAYFKAHHTVVVLRLGPFRSFDEEHFARFLLEYPRTDLQPEPEPEKILVPQVIMQRVQYVAVGADGFLVGPAHLDFEPVALHRPARSRESRASAAAQPAAQAPATSELGQPDFTDIFDDLESEDEDEAPAAEATIDTVELATAQLHEVLGLEGPVEDFEGLMQIMTACHENHRMHAEPSGEEEDNLPPPPRESEASAEADDAAALEAGPLQEQVT
jgi:hypothetical protein